MGKDEILLLRVQAREGTKRLQMSPNSDTKTLFEFTRNAYGYSSYAFELFKDKEKRHPIVSSGTKTLKGEGFKHGDLIYLAPLNGAILMSEAMSVEDLTVPNTPAHFEQSPSSSSLAQINKAEELVEDEVDAVLEMQDGKIERPKDPKMCRHDDNGRCIFCNKLEPYDESYLKANNIKHLSFHSYLKQLTGGIDKGKFAALEDLNVSIKKGCTTHPPWPRGICSKCQPSAITLNRQSYRHVDNVMFENPQIVEKFLSYWRTSGHQRAGFLYGTYEEHTDVPLGIRARVSAIYEPPQESSRDFINFLPDEKAGTVNEVAEGLGLKCVGWIFTDLIPENISAGTVKQTRGINTYFLSAQECITAAYLQNLHPNPCKISQKKTFGSKFASVIVTGDESNQVQMTGYQVSNQCMSLVRENCLVPTKDAPEYGYIINSSESKFVPDVYYKLKDKYGNEVSQMARPLPVEYLLVDVTVSTPKEPISMFTLKKGVTPFPVENRYIDGHIQDFNALATYLNQFKKTDAFLKIASDFHFLIFITSMDILPLRDFVGPLIKAVKEKNGLVAEDWKKSDYWGTVEKLIEASTVSHGEVAETSGSSSRPQAIISPQSTWTCSHCTFRNGGTTNNCEVCSIRRTS